MMVLHLRAALRLREALRLRKTLRLRRAASSMLAACALAGLGLSMPGAAGARQAHPIVIHDDRGIEHRFDAPPQRIVTMLPSLTETAWVLGVGSRLIGVDRFSNWPDEIAGLPHLGGLEDAHIEAIAALAPDVVLASTSSRAMERL
mgnify:CR=1 FL=1